MPSTPVGTSHPWGNSPSARSSSLSPRNRSQRKAFNTGSLLSAVLILLVLNLALLVWHQFGLSVEQDSATYSGSSQLEEELTYFTSSPEKVKRTKQVKASRLLKTNTAQRSGYVNSHYPIYYHPKMDSFHSTVHCVGEGFEIEHAWIYRSCHFRNLCMDTETHEYVLFASPEEQAIRQTLERSSHAKAKKDDDDSAWPYIHIPTTTFGNSSHVSIGGINTKWTWDHGVPRLEWFPKILDAPPPEGVYMLDERVVWAPFHSMAGFNVGHQIWDDYLPIYTLLSMFQLLPENDFELLLTRYILPGSDPLWASCETQETNNLDMCNTMFRKFVPLMGIAHYDHFSTNRDIQVRLNGTIRSKYVCARNGAAGLGMLTDHGTKLHGWSKTDFESMHNHGRGGALFAFRQFLTSNLGLSHLPSQVKPKPPYRITISVKSSSNPNRNIDFAKQVGAIKQAFPPGMVLVQLVELKEMSLEEQVRVASETSIFISACGGGAVTATFLPRGSSVLLYFVHRSRRSEGPARLDWDLFSNAAYLRTHWLPKQGMDEPNRLEMLVKLIQLELDTISHSQ